MELLMNKNEFIKALSEPYDKSCLNCKFARRSGTMPEDGYNNKCGKCHEHDPEMINKPDLYPEDNWEWNGDK